MTVWKRIAPFLAIALVFSLAACGSGGQAKPQPTAGPAETRESGAAPETETREEPQTIQNDAEETMRLRIGETEVSVDWEKNEATDALTGLAKAKPIVIGMSMYGGFEQVGPLGAALPAQDERITTEAGDIVLYAGNQIVVFYGTNTWSYTRLGRIKDRTAAEMAALLGGGDVTITITYGGE